MWRGIYFDQGNQTSRPDCSGAFHDRGGCGSFDECAVSCLHSHLPLVCIRRGLQRLPTQILSARRIPIFHPPTVFIYYSSRCSCSVLLNGTFPCYSKANDRELECFRWSYGNRRCSETFSLSLEKYRGRGSSCRIDLGNCVYFGWIYYFFGYRNCANRRGSFITREKLGIVHMSGDYLSGGFISCGLRSWERAMLCQLKEGNTQQHSSMS
mmetsp:Transcript_29674/g.63580  ORF Transcript_29674/g.63580 Transcript_29674/m.63580 type:complete len:210 (-) Transcript_29674:233-862(-)